MMDRRTLLATAAMTSTGLLSTLAKGRAAETAKADSGVIVIAEAKGANPDQIGKALKQIMSGGVPEGIAAQMMGKSPDGVTMITVWDNPKGAKAFVKDHVMPALKKQGVKVTFNRLPLLKLYKRA